MPYPRNSNNRNNENSFTTWQKAANKHFHTNNDTPIGRHCFPRQHSVIPALPPIYNNQLQQ